MKQLIKIGLIVLAVAGIAWFAWSSMDSIGSGDKTKIENMDFYKYVEDRVKNELGEKVAFSKAESAYKSIVADIQTEAAQSGLSESDRKSCMKQAVFAFAPMLASNALSYFRGSAWDGNSVNSWRAKAQELRGTGFIQSGSQVDRDLSEVISVADSYNGAVAACNVGQCTSPEAVKAAIAKAESFKKAPLTNDKALMGRLGAVGTTAKNSYANYVLNYCNNIASNWDEYSNYDSWRAKYQSAHNMISTYTSAFGDDSRFSSARAALERAEDRADAYYTE